MADTMGDGTNAGLLSELMNSVPGIDEAMSFAELMRFVAFCGCFMNPHRRLKNRN
jgi:anion-transporting  ArsA/GET3 family ATPase